ncbi:MAG: ester cyclase [Solirubrobacterales bacterium]|nr:ester cyclase [Solirubrobacterales bacterium]MBV9338222.1 ester cyclase [Solirubrobacterales bacterium]
MTSVSERNKSKVQLFVQAVWNEGRLEMIDELVAADHLEHVWCLQQPVVGPNGVRQLVSSRRRAYPDLYIKIEDQIAEDDLVATRWRATATGPATLAATSRPRCWAGISLIRLLAGKQVDAHTAMAPSTTEVAR